MNRAALLLALSLSACAALPQPPRDDALFARIHAGMSEAEIRAALGPPDNTMPFPNLHQSSWGYFYWDGWGVWSEFSVTFAADGHAVSTHTRRYDGGDKGQ